MERGAKMILLKGEISLIPNFTSEADRKAMLTTEISIKELLDVYKVDSTVNRDIRYDGILKLERYLDQINTNMGIYIPAIILSYEGEDPTHEGNEFLFKNNRSFVVLDGQHRIKAIEAYINKVNNKKKINSILESNITVQIYFNLSKEEKKQLFIEINGKARKVSHNVSVQYDDRNPVNSLISDLIKDKRSPLNRMGVEQKKSRIVRPGNTNWISMVRLSRFISYLILGSGSSESIKSRKLINNQYEQLFHFLQQYFIFLESALPPEPGNVSESILGHEAIQNAIAVVCHNYIVERKGEQITFKSNWKQFIEMFEYIDWDINSSIFKNHLYLSAGKNKYIRFPDSKHYELVPILERELLQLLT